MNEPTPPKVLLDLNNPVFQHQLFDLQKNEQLSVLKTLRKLAGMDWYQVHKDHGLKWEIIASRRGPQAARLYSFRIGKGFREMKRKAAMEIIGNGEFENLFESIEGNDFETG